MAGGVKAYGAALLVWTGVGEEADFAKSAAHFRPRLCENENLPLRAFAARGGGFGKTKICVSMRSAFPASALEK